MPEIVTLDEARLFLRVDGNHEDGTIALLIAAATEAVLSYANGWDGLGDVPARIRLAVLARVAISFDDREKIEAGHGEDRLLWPYRTLSV